MKLFVALSLVIACAALPACDEDTSFFGYEAGLGEAGETLDGALSTDTLSTDTLGADTRETELGRDDTGIADGVVVATADSATADTISPTVDTLDTTVDTISPDTTVDTISPDTTVDTISPDTTVDTLSPDTTVDTTVDTLSPDTTVDTTVDTLSPDTTVDTTVDSSSPPPGLSEPCQNGSGWTLFRFHYDAWSTSPRIDVWDASCSYSYVINSACNARTVYPGFGEVDTTSEGYPILTTSEYLRVRFSVAGLSFSQAAVYVKARSYATASSTYYRVWSPLYGDQVGGPVDNDWVYDWYGVDWSDYLYPSDSPSLTAIQIYAGQGSAKLAVSAVELCVE
ncbi:MAG: hypothetical protein JRH20_16760 [Deltaproteobacteria bacterium]|nr:hypothetical protein [Deltaproteobacteria bacterium]